MNTQTLDFIKALITKTKSSTIMWKPLKYVNDIKPAQKDVFDNAIAPLPAFYFETKGSYYTEQPGGKIFLAVINSPFIPSKSVHLIVQTDRSEYSMTYATSNDNNTDIASQLKRLYNIVISDETDFNSFVNSIIKG